jgi:nucleotide-binding universal stress UspA family protein
MYRSVIVPLDRSAASEHVLPIAVQIAHGSDAILRLLYIPNPEDVSMLESQMPLDIVLPARSSMPPETYLNHIRRRLTARSDVKVTADVLHEANGQAGTTNTDISDMDLVVLATHDPGGLIRVRLDDITAALMRWHAAPILALRPPNAALDPEVQPTFQRMLIPLDGSGLAEQILVPAVALGTAMRAEYTLLYVIEPASMVSGKPASDTAALDDATLVHAQAEAQDYLDGIALMMRVEGLQVETQVAVARDARTAIRQAVRQHEIDVIALTTHWRGELDRLLVGSVAVQVLHDSHIPVLLYRPHQRRKRAARA